MRDSLRRTTFLGLQVALAFCVANVAGQSANNQTIPQPSHTDSHRDFYIVENPTKRFPAPRAVGGPVLSGDSMEQTVVDERPFKKELQSPTRYFRPSPGKPITDQAPPPQRPKPTEGPTPQIPPLPPERVSIAASGSSPLTAVTVVGMGALAGILVSFFVIKQRFAIQLATRPNGDISRRVGDENQPHQPWQVYARSLQLQSAVRAKLISPEEFRELRSKYLLPGNFGFSMFLPIALALVLIGTSAGDWYQRIAVLIGGALTAYTLTTYALDRRHRFRAEYRTLIINNLNKPHIGEDFIHAEETPTENAEMQILIRLMDLVSSLIAKFRSGSPS